MKIATQWMLFAALFLSALAGVNVALARRCRHRPTPFPEKDKDWPGKGVIRKFDFMVGERKAFWKQRKNDQGR